MNKTDLAKQLRERNEKWSRYLLKTHNHTQASFTKLMEDMNALEDDAFIQTYLEHRSRYLKLPDLETLNTMIEGSCCSSCLLDKYDDFTLKDYFTWKPSN